MDTPIKLVWRLSQFQQELMNSENPTPAQCSVIGGYFGAILEALAHQNGPDWALAAERTCITNEYLRDVVGYLHFKSFMADVQQARLAALEVSG